jgi:hypothetical protein
LLNRQYGTIVSWHKPQKSYKVLVDKKATAKKSKKSKKSKGPVTKTKVVNVPCGSLEKNGFMHSTDADGFAGYDWANQSPAQDAQLYANADRMYGMRGTFSCESVVDTRSPGGQIHLDCTSKVA